MFTKKLLAFNVRIETVAFERCGRIAAFYNARSPPMFESAHGGEIAHIANNIFNPEGSPRRGAINSTPNAIKLKARLSGF